MKTNFAAVLAFSVALPALALAQGVPAGTAQDSHQTNQNNARGGMPDAPRTNRPSQIGEATSVTAGPFVTVPAHGAWLFSDLKGRSVSSTEGETMGTISDVLVSQDGSVTAVVIGVGGFLGIGEKDVAVDISALVLGPATPAKPSADKAVAVSPETTASTTPAQTGERTGAAAGAGQSPAKKVDEHGMPERIVLNVTREQLQDAPVFEGMTPAR